jgi:hypothetical protein
LFHLKKEGITVAISEPPDQLLRVSTRLAF